MKTAEKQTRALGLAKDGAVAVFERRHVGAGRTRQRRAAKADRHGNRRQDHQTAEHREHAAPAQEIPDQTGGGRAQEITGHGAGQRAADRDLTLFGRNQIAGQPERDRKHAAGTDAG